MKENWQEQLKDLLNCDLKTLISTSKKYESKIRILCWPNK